MAKKHPFNKILDSIYDIMSLIDDQGIKPAEDKITPEKMAKLQALWVIAKEYNDVADNLLEKQGATEKVIPKDESLESLPTSDKKLFDRLEEMKQELQARQQVIKQVIKRETKAPEDAAKKKKKKKKTRLKKFRGVGGKKGWKPI